MCEMNVWNCPRYTTQLWRDIPGNLTGRRGCLFSKDPSKGMLSHSTADKDLGIGRGIRVQGHEILPKGFLEMN